MQDISEKVSYLQGLSEGLNIREGSPQGKIISGMLGVLDEIANAITEVQDQVDELHEYVESMDEDLQELEDKRLDEDMEYLEMRCHNCGEDIYFESEVLDDEDTVEIICPYCDEVVFINDGSFDYEPSFNDDEITQMKPRSENPSPS